MPLRFVRSSCYEANIGRHVFPTQKYRLIETRLRAAGILRDELCVEAPRAQRDDVLRVHTPEFLEDFLALRWTPRTISSELPLTQAVVEMFMHAAGGSVLGARLALEPDCGGVFHIGGGFHHAFANHAEGFCYLNDIAMAVRALKAERRIARAVVVDLDLHQGNGTAHIFEDNPDVFTFSMHQENNYPVKQRSHLDIGLDDGAGDDDYLAALRGAIPRIYDEHRPEFLVYVAGADPYLDDQLGGLKLTMAGLRARDEAVLRPAVEREIPFLVVLAGGYARKVEDTVAIHSATAEVAATLLGK